MKPEKGCLPFVILVALLFCIGVPLIVITKNSDNSHIQKWATKNDHSIVKSEECIWETGPFWFRPKGSRIYKVQVENGQVFWFRFGTFSIDVEKENEEEKTNQAPQDHG